MAKTRYYAVRRGRKPGIYTSWEEVKEQVLGFEGAQHKSFDSRDAAQAWIDGIDAARTEAETLRR